MRARIYQPAKSAMQSGQARSARFVLEFDGQAARSLDPLMGWVSGADTQAQLRLTFPSAQAAMDYCREQGIEYELSVSANPARRPKSYADNFAAGRKIPWSH